MTVLDLCPRWEWKNPIIKFSSLFTACAKSRRKTDVYVKLPKRAFRLLQIQWQWVSRSATLGRGSGRVVMVFAVSLVASSVRTNQSRGHEITRDDKKMSVGDW